MYYVLQVSPGMEDTTERLIRGRVKKSVYGCCFHPLRHVQKKFRGEWKDFHDKLLPGYVFITSDSVGELYMELRRVPALTKMLGKDDEWFAALPEKDIEWLGRLTETAKGAGSETVYSRERNKTPEEDGTGQESDTLEIELSQIAVEGDAIKVLSGPLINMDGYIRKINLHRRIAEVEIDFMGKKTVVHLGVEMVGKRENQTEKNVL